MRRFICVLAVLGLATWSCGDRPAPATTRVFASSNGYWYARTTPASTIACTEGTTRVYRVNHFGRGDGQDQLAHEFDWYAPQLYLHAIAGNLSIVRFGCWPHGQLASDDQLALVLYWNGKEVRTFSTLDIAGHPNNVDSSVSHHTVFSTVHGFKTRWSHEHQKAIESFEVQTIDGRTLAFDLKTGAVNNADTIGVPLHEALRAFRETPSISPEGADHTDP